VSVPYRVLQVGCGPTGTSVLRELLPRLADVPLAYEVADPAVMGPGLAFSTPWDLHLLNVRAGRMSPHPTDKAEFAVAGGAGAQRRGLPALGGVEPGDLVVAERGNAADGGHHLSLQGSRTTTNDCRSISAPEW
jgi:hypothetical protein